MTVDQLIAQVLETRATKLKERNTHTEKLAELRSQEAPDEAAISQARGAQNALDAELDVIDDRLKELREEKARDEAAARMNAETLPATPARKEAFYGDANRTGQEPRMYTRETAKTGRSYFADAYRMQQNDENARQRLVRHAQEVEVHGEMTERATTTGSFAGLVIPQYLPDMYAPVLRNGRPTANVVAKHQIPADGMTVYLQRGTTGASAAVQAAQNTSVSNTDQVWADLAIPVVTVAGQQDVSRQSLERGTALDEIIYMDLAKAYAAAVDVQVLSGTGSSGQALGILNTAGIGAASAFGAAVTPTNFNLKIAGAATNVYSAGQGLGPELLIMHPRRWGWLTGQVDSTGRPIVTANTVANFNANAVGTIAGEEFSNQGTPIAGIHSSGLPVLLDLNIPTTAGTLNEDLVLAVDADELHLWEDGDGLPRQLRFEQTTGGSLTTKLVVYGYIAFSAGRYPQAVSKVGGVDATAGQGLIAPTF